MKITPLRRTLAGAAVVVVAAAGVGLASTPASATTAGTLTISPASGSAANTPSFVTSGKCTAATEDVIVTVSGGTGAGALTGTQNYNGANTAGNLSTSGSGYAIAGSGNWASFASANSLTTLLGTYTVQVECSGGNVFPVQVSFTGTGLSTADTYQQLQTTTTAVTAISGSTYGTAKSFTATVNAGSLTATGSVQFNEGASVLGSANLSAGSATLTGQNLPAGSHTITAIYTPDATATTAGIQASSDLVGATYTVGQATPVVTLGDNTADTIGQGGSTTFNLSSGGVAGTFALKYSSASNSLSNVVLNSSISAPAGSASYLWGVPFAQAAGTDYVITATFTPTDTNDYVSGGTATVNPFTVTVKPSVNNNETIQVTVPVGALSATVSANSVVTLAGGALSSNGNHFIFTGSLNTVKVVDTRAGDFGWTSSVQATDFVGCSVFAPAANSVHNDAANPTNTVAQLGCTTGYASLAPKSGLQQNTINAYNLGISPTKAADVTNSLTLNTGIAEHSAWNAELLLPGATGTSGLRDSRTLVTGTGQAAGTDSNGASAVIGSATGTALVGGGLTLNVPTVTVAGAYASTVTVTVV